MAAPGTKRISSLSYFAAAAASIIGIFLLVGLARFGSHSLFVSLIEPRQWPTLGDKLRDDADINRLRKTLGLALDANGRREPSVSDGESESVATITIDRSDAMTAEKLRRLTRLLRSRVTGCASAQSIVSSLNDVTYTAPVRVTHDELAPEIRSALNGVSPGKLSAPVTRDSNIQLYIRCSN